MASSYETLSQRAFLVPEIKKPKKPAVEYLPPMIGRHPGVGYEYPRTMLNALLQKQRLHMVEAMLIEDDIMELYQDHFDSDALEQGNLIEGAVSVIKKRMAVRHIEADFRVQALQARHGNKIEHDIRQALKKKQSVILGDTQNAVLVTGMLHDDLLIQPPFPAIDEDSGAKHVLSLAKIAKAVAKKEGFAWSIS